MAEWLKRATAAPGAAPDVSGAVRALLDEIRAGGDGAALAIAQRLDGWSGPPVVVHQHFEAGVSRQELAEILPKVKAAAEAGIVDKMRRGVIR